MPQIITPYTPYEGLGGLVKALSIAAGLNIDFDNSNIDQHLRLFAQAPFVPQNQPQVIATCPRHPVCTRARGHSGRCRIKAAYQPKEILPDATGHRQCPYDNDCVNEAGHRGRCKIRPKVGAAAHVQMPSATVTSTRQDEEEPGLILDKSQQNDAFNKEAGHLIERTNAAAPLETRKIKNQQQPPAAGTTTSAEPPQPRKRKPIGTLEEYNTSGSEEEQEEEEKDQEESDRETDESDEDDEVEEEKEEIFVPKWPARKRPRGRIAGVHSADRQQPPAQPLQMLKSPASASGMQRTADGDLDGGDRPSSATAAAAAAPVTTPGINHVSEFSPIVNRILAASPPAAAAAPAGASALVQQCRAVEAALAKLPGATAYDRLSYSMKFATLPAEVRKAQWDALQRHINEGNVEAVVAVVREQARCGGRGAVPMY